MNAYKRAIASLYNLKSLQFKGGELTPDTGLCSIAERRANLQHLEIYVCDDISLQGLEAIVTACVDLICMIYDV